jgi:uncharacterized protein YdiU (UPF0061 family)
MARRNLGLECIEADDVTLLHDFLDAMQVGKADYTLAWRYLADAAESNPVRLRSVFRNDTTKLDEWLPRWQDRLNRENRSTAEIAANMRRVNPYVIPRNHLVEAALEAATINNDFAPFNQLLDVLSDPYTESEAAHPYAIQATPEQTAGYRTFCGT